MTKKVFSLWIQYLYQLEQLVGNVTLSYFHCPAKQRGLLFRVWKNDAAWKSAFFAYIISQKQRATQWKKFQRYVSQVKQSLHARIQLFLSTFKNGQKILGTFLPMAF